MESDFRRANRAISCTDLPGSISSPRRWSYAGDSPKRLANLAHQPLHLRAVDHIGHNWAHRLAGADLGAGGRQLLRAPPDDHHLRAGLGELPRYRRANPAAATRHQRNFAF